MKLRLTTAQRSYRDFSVAYARLARAQFQLHRRDPGAIDIILKHVHSETLLASELCRVLIAIEAKGKRRGPRE